MLPFHATECLVGPDGILVVGARERGTRVASCTRDGVEELALPFDPPRGLPVAWLTDRRFVVVGRDGRYLVVTIGGGAESHAIAGPCVIRGVAGPRAFAAGPQFFVLRDDRFVADGPAAEDAGDADELDFSAPTHRTEMVDACSDGALPVAFGVGVYWVRTRPEGRSETWPGTSPGTWPDTWPGTWVKGITPTRARITAAVSLPDGAVIACGAKGTLIRVQGSAIEPVAHDLGSVGFTAIAASDAGLLLGTDVGLWRLARGKAIPVELPGTGAVDSISTLGEVCAVVRSGTALLRSSGPWAQIELPDPPPRAT